MLQHDDFSGGVDEYLRERRRQRCATHGAAAAFVIVIVAIALCAAYAKQIGAAFGARPSAPAGGAGAAYPTKFATDNRMIGYYYPVRIANAPSASRVCSQGLCAPDDQLGELHVGAPADPRDGPGPPVHAPDLLVLAAGQPDDLGARGPQRGGGEQLQGVQRAEEVAPVADHHAVRWWRHPCNRAGRRRRLNQCLMKSRIVDRAWRQCRRCLLTPLAARRSPRQRWSSRAGTDSTAWVRCSSGEGSQDVC